MKKHITAAALAAAVITVFVCSAAAQQIDPSYELSLQVVVGSNEGSRAELPSNLTSISRQLKTSFAFSNYRVAGTYLGRVSNNGSFEYKSPSSLFGADTELRTRPIFMEWSLSDLRSGPTTKGPLGFSGRTFRFGASVPVIIQGPAETKTVPVVNYEKIGLSIERFGVPENIPTLIGTLNLPGANGTVFLVMTIKTADI